MADTGKAITSGHPSGSPQVVQGGSADNLTKQQGEVFTGWVAQAHNPMSTSSFLKRNPECRICLQGALTDNPLIIPCKCLGSMKFMHDTCYQQWLEHKLIGEANINRLAEQGLLCEICKTPLKVEIVSSTQFNSCNRIGAKMCVDKIATSMSILTLLATMTIWIAGTVALVVYSRTQKVFDYSSSILIVSLCAIAVGGVLFLLAVASFIRKFFIRIRWRMVRQTKTESEAK